MIPSTNNILTDELEMEELPSKDYRMDFNCHVIGKCDELEAMKQVVFKILNTERYQYIIYSWDYGIELADLIGEPMDYVCAELERRINEALTQDDRIDSVDGFEFDISKKHQVVCTFIVHTIFGDVDAESEVTI